jgi:hypothetical protein
MSSSVAKPADMSNILQHMETFLNAKFAEILEKQKKTPKPRKSKKTGVDETATKSLLSRAPLCETLNEDVDQAECIRPLCETPKIKKMENAILTDNIHLFDEDSLLLLDHQPKDNTVWISYVPLTPVEGEEDSPIIEVDKKKLLVLLKKVTEKSRVLTIPGRIYDIVPNYRANYNDTEAEWQIIETAAVTD